MIKHAAKAFRNIDDARLHPLRAIYCRSYASCLVLAPLTDLTATTNAGKTVWDIAEEHGKEIALDAKALFQRWPKRESSQTNPLLALLFSVKKQRAFELASSLKRIAHEKPRSRHQKSSSIGDMAIFKLFASSPSRSGKAGGVTRRNTRSQDHFERWNMEPKIASIKSEALGHQPDDMAGRRA